jgi:hypothetical protein
LRKRAPQLAEAIDLRRAVASTFHSESLNMRPGAGGIGPIRASLGNGIDAVVVDDGASHAKPMMIDDPAAPAPHTGPLPVALVRNLLFGVRAALLWRVPLDRVATGWIPIVFALLLAPLPWFLVQWIEIGPQGQFSSWGLPGISFPFVLMVIAATVATCLLGRAERTSQLLLALLNANIVIDIAVCTLPFLGAADTGIYLDRFGGDLAGYWLGLALAVLVLRLRGWRHVRSWLVAIGVGSLLTFASNHIWQFTTVWNDASIDEQSEAGTPEFDDDLIYSQPGLLNQQLERLQPGAPNSAQLFFLGVAGDSAQKVFLREIRSVYQIMLGRFTSPEHSLLLINNEETLRAGPIATTTSIEAAAKRIGAVMDRDNDVLFIYLTSHGSQEDGFSLNLPPLRLRDLQPAELRRILDEAGIRWRVIVVSACYSGVFLQPLESDQALVITAAAADRTSFGCADENDYTYFGRAYFEEALAGTDSFVEAFERAREIVTAREKAEGETPSLPQISLGRDIAEKLQALRPANPQERP